MSNHSKVFSFLILLLICAIECKAGSIFGDADADGDVDGDDIIAVQTHFGGVGPVGDSDCDGDVDSDDLLATTSVYYGNMPLPGAAATFEFSDPDNDETFDVFFSVSNSSSAGLALFNIGIRDLANTGIDANSIIWQQNVLSNINASFQPTGFDALLIDSPVGNDPFAFNALNDQIESMNPIYGIGQNPVFAEGSDIVPNNPDIVLSTPALLGQLTIPGIYNIPAEEALSLLRPEALLFFTENVNDQTGSPVSIEVLLTTTNVPEPTTASLLLLAGIFSPLRSRL